MHPAAATIAMHTTRSAMILSFIHNASPCEIFISVVNFELFCSYPDRVIFLDSYNSIFLSDDVKTIIDERGNSACSLITAPELITMMAYYLFAGYRIRGS